MEDKASIEFTQYRVRYYHDRSHALHTTYVRVPKELFAAETATYKVKKDLGHKVTKIEDVTEW